MSYCLNPVCSNPENSLQAAVCQTCGLPLLVRDRYRATQLLAKGGFGATFLAEDISLPGQPTCVIKQLRPPSESPKLLSMARELFGREAKTLGKLGSHPQLPRLLDYFELSQDFFLVQEYISGLTLQQVIQRTGPMTEAEVRTVLLELLTIVDFLHQQGVIHRDIKPANIIRREFDSKLVLIDFGAVKDQVSQLSGLSPDGETTLTSFAIGTPGFSPPEQAALRPVYASDIYALGMTCVYLLTGKNPQDLGYDPSTGELRWRDRLPLRESFTGVITKMLDASVRDRFPSAQAVLQALDLEPHRDGLRPAGGHRLAQGLSWQRTGTRQVSDHRRPSRGFNRLSQGSEGQSPGKDLPKAAARSQPVPHARRIGTARKITQPAAKLDAAGLQAAYRQGKRDFVELDLRALNLKNANLAGAIFHQTNLQRTNLQGANLDNANFSKANLKGAVLRGAHLSRAYLNYANLEGADLEGADLSHAYLSHANLVGANLVGANLVGAKVTQQQLASARTNRSTILPNGKKAGWW